MLSGAGVSGDVCRVIGECVGVRREEVKAQLLRDTSQVSPSTLTDFDWKLKVRNCYLFCIIFSFFCYHSVENLLGISSTEW